MFAQSSLAAPAEKEVDVPDVSVDRESGEVPPAAALKKLRGEAIQNAVIQLDRLSDVPSLAPGQ